MELIKIMPCLDMKNGGVVKGVHFVDLKEAGNPVSIPIMKLTLTKPLSASAKTKLPGNDQQIFPDDVKYAREYYSKLADVPNNPLPTQQ